MNAFVILGDANTRKSSVLRSLTGCFNRSVRQVQLSSGSVLDIYARVSSLQESETEPQKFINEVAGTGQSSVIFCLWPHANSKNPLKYPDAHAYISAFTKAGWQFRASAVLGASPIRPATPRVAYFPTIVDQPINIGAQSVRQHFQWL
ncbi:hypothetical protein ACO2Q9_01335 [Variovorax sp. VNK109]|uniref:hypothetical protein n=1 Tax=Variovorax sp. VNK109 TaxID=3400919 RepID=UPI003C0F8925